MAAQFTATKGLSARGLDWCSARATTSLPVPVSPSSRTGSSLARPWRAMRSARAKRLSRPASSSSTWAFCVEGALVTGAVPPRLV
ncbi:hypothetical protein D9M69_502540 [compost metagenome]